eukprot:7221505-Pyramimonas_sp.AAC.1
MTGSAPAPATNSLQSTASSGSDSGTSAPAALCPDSCFSKPSPAQGGDEVDPRNRDPDCPESLAPA